MFRFTFLIVGQIILPRVFVFERNASVMLLLVTFCNLFFNFKMNIHNKKTGNIIYVCTPGLPINTTIFLFRPDETTFRIFKPKNHRMMPLGPATYPLPLLPRKNTWRIRWQTSIMQAPTSWLGWLLVECGIFLRAKTYWWKGR